MKTFNVFFKILVSVFMVFVIVIGTIFAINMLKDDEPQVQVNPPIVNPEPTPSDDDINIVVPDDNNQIVTPEPQDPVIDTPVVEPQQPSQSDYDAYIEQIFAQAQPHLEEVQNSAFQFGYSLESTFDNYPYECSVYVSPFIELRERGLSNNLEDMYTTIYVDFELQIYPLDDSVMMSEEEAYAAVQGVNFDTVVDTIIQSTDYNVEVYFVVSVDGFNHPYTVHLQKVDGQVTVSGTGVGDSTYNGVYAH